MYPSTSLLFLKKNIAILQVCAKITIIFKQNQKHATKKKSTTAARLNLIFCRSNFICFKEEKKYAGGISTNVG